MRSHELRHERQKGYQIECHFENSGTQVYQTGIKCTIRVNDSRSLEYHIQQNHTVEGLARKLHSEHKMSELFKTNGIANDRDWTNTVTFRGCTSEVEGNAYRARPDFFLLEVSAQLGALVLIGNGEYAHRRYPYDLQRVFDIANALETQYPNVPLVYIRFNPHYFERDGVFCDIPLAIGLIHNLEKSQFTDNGVHLIFINYDTLDGNVLALNPQGEDTNDYVTLYRDRVLSVH